MGEQRALPPAPGVAGVSGLADEVAAASGLVEEIAGGGGEAMTGPGGAVDTGGSWLVAAASAAVPEGSFACTVSGAGEEAGAAEREATGLGGLAEADLQSRGGDSAEAGA